ncbi:unnamed protein product [Discula destructiva]
MTPQPPPFLVLPRPGAAGPSEPPAPISAPTEQAMTATFGVLLPAAQYLTTRHGRAAYYVYPPTAPTASPAPLRILMLHGVQTPALGLHPLTTALRARFPAAHIALLELWGHGLSDTPLVPHTPALFHELVDHVLAALGWDTAHLLGYSFGGSTVVGYAASSPARAARVASLALVAPAGLLRAAQFGDRVRREYLDVDAAGDEQGAWDWMLDYLEGGKLVVPGDWRERVGSGEVVAPALREWEMREHGGHVGSVVGMFRDGGALDNHAAFVEVAKAGIPCFSVVGELDGVCGADALQQVGLPNVVVVPQAGHALVRDRVPEVAQPLGDFWKSL